MASGEREREREREGESVPRMHERAPRALPPLSLLGLSRRKRDCSLTLLGLQSCLGDNLGQTTWNLTGVSPKRDCGTKSVKSTGSRPLFVAREILSTIFSHLVLGGRTTDFCMANVFMRVVRSACFCMNAPSSVVSIFAWLVV